MAKRAQVKLSELRRIATLQPTQAEAAAALGVSVGTFKKVLKNKKAQRAWEDGKAKGRLSLRRRQYNLASSNAQMAIHLGKHWLDQNDVVSHEHTGKDGGPIQSVDLGKLDASERQKLREILTGSNRPE